MTVIEKEESDKPLGTSLLFFQTVVVGLVGNIISVYETSHS